MAARVLIIFPGALGDLICLAPTIAAIAQRHHDAELELMARGELSEFAVGRLDVMRAYSIDRREVALLFREPAHEEEDRARRFFSLFARIYCFFSVDDARFRNALTAASAPALTTFHPFRPHAAGHVAAAYLKDVTGADAVDPITIHLLPSDLAEASRAIFRIAGPKKFIAIFPGSGGSMKNWPIEKFRDLATRINIYSRAVFILGPAEDRAENIIQSAGHLIIKGQPLGVVAAIASMASAFVGNDSGVSHLAAATGTPGVVLFGPSDPDRWRPLGHVTVLHREPIASIEVAEVRAALDAQVL